MSKIRNFYLSKNRWLIVSLSILLAGCATSNEFTCGTPSKGYCASLDTVNQMVDEQKIGVEEKPVKRISSEQSLDENPNQPSDFQPQKNHLIWIAPHLDEMGYHTAHYLEEQPDALF